MKFYAICCVLAQILYLGKIWFLRYGPKCSWPTRLQDFKSNISPEQNDEKAWIFACWYRFMGSRSWLKNVGVDIIKNGCVNSVLRTLKLALCQGKMNEINWFLLCWYKFIGTKSYFNSFLVVVVKNRCDLLGHGTLKSAVLQGPIDKMS